MKFGVREICDVTFKATTDGQKLGAKVFKKHQPVFMIDTARTSNLEQATTTVYAQGGRGYSRLIAWEGEKTMTFTVEDALISPMGLAVLSGAGLIKAANDNNAKVHTTVQTTISNEGKVSISLADLQEETGLTTATKFTICHMIPMYATTFINDGGDSGFYEIEAPVAAVDVTAQSPAVLTVKDFVSSMSGATVVVDFYLTMSNSVTTVEIKPEDFGGFFYVEAQTLFRDEATGKDMAANLTFPKVKIQSGFTFTMAASGDPSTFTFTMDAFPGYALCKPEKKTMVDIQIISSTSDSDEAGDANYCNGANATDTPSFKDALAITSALIASANFPGTPDSEAVNNQDDATELAKVGNVITLSKKTGEVWQAYTRDGVEGKWVAVSIGTGETDITKVSLNGTAFTTTDKTTATSYGLSDGYFVHWINVEDTEEENLKLETEDKEANITIRVVNE